MHDGTYDVEAIGGAGVSCRESRRVRGRGTTVESLLEVLEVKMSSSNDGTISAQ